eukprot:6945643-Pyramimonas_sp.AAC.1
MPRRGAGNALSAAASMPALVAAATSLQRELFNAIARAALGARKALSTASSSRGPWGGRPASGHSNQLGAPCPSRSLGR